MISESILAKIDAIEAKALHIAAQRDSAIKDAEESIAMYRRARDRAEEWQLMAIDLAKALEYASEQLDDLGVFGCAAQRKDVLERYNKLLNRRTNSP